MDMVYRYAYSLRLQSRSCSVSRSAALNLLSTAKQFKTDVRIATHFHGDVKIFNEINMITNEGHIFMRIRKIAKNEYYLFVMSVHLSVLAISAPIGRILMKFDI